jgi:uncharacterized protein
MAETTQEARKQVPIRADIFTMPPPGEKPQLIGCRCPRCGESYFPRRQICLACGQNGMERALLGPRGAVSTFTIVHQKTGGSLVEPPYAIAQVRLDEGLTVQALLTESDPGKIACGIAVEMVLEKLGETAEGEDLIAFKFRPL